MKYNFSNLSDIKVIENEMPFADRLTTKTMYRRLCKTRDKYPDRPAFSFQLKSGPNDKKITLSYDELTKRVTQAANLFHSLGIKPGDVVASLLPSTHETLITMLGAMTAGIIFPINPTLSAKQISTLLKETNAKVLVTMRAFPKTNIAQIAATAVSESPCIKTVIEIDLLPHLSPPLSWIVPLIRPKNPIRHNAEILEFNKVLNQHNDKALDFKERTDDQICAYFHTGGTTGMPKIVQHRHSGALYNGWLGKNLLMDETDVMLCPMPLFHVFASYPAWAATMTAGAHMIVPTPAGYRGKGVLDNFWKLIERYKATFIITVPTAAASLMQRPVNADISTLKNAFCGSAPLPVELFNKFQKATNVQIIEGYGMTEVTCLISCNPEHGERKIGSVGLPLPYTDVKIMHVDKDNVKIKECDVGETGEVCITNPGVIMNGTYTNHSQNKNLYIDNTYLRSGDIGYKDSDGYLWLTGRAKDLILRGGHNIDPALIEEAIAAHPAIAFVAAIGQPDVYSGELPCAYVELIEGKNCSSDDLMSFVKDIIPDPTAMPKYIEIVQQLPKTAIGKIFKPQLRCLAITRIYNSALAEAGLKARVISVKENNKRELVAQIEPLDKNCDPTYRKINAVLGQFIHPWEWAETNDS